MSRITRQNISDYPVIGGIFVFKLNQKSIDKNNIEMSLSQDQSCDVFEVICIEEAPNGVKIYITNVWNDTFNQVQMIPEYFVQEFVKYKD